MFPPIASGAEIINPQIQSLTNHPLLSNVRWTGTEPIPTAGGRIFFDVQFPNSCLMSSGISASYFARTGPGLDRRDLSFILIEQKSAPDGCPEIFEPVMRSYRLDLPASTFTDRLLFLNVVNSESPQERRLQIATVKKRSKHKAAPADTGPELLTLTRQNKLPVLSNVNVETKSDREYVQYRLQFSVTFINACQAAHADALIFEGRMPARANMLEPAYDWIWIKPGGVQSRCPEEISPVTKRFSLSHRVRSDYGRVIVLTNAVAAQPIYAQNRLVAYRVWPLPAKFITLP